MEDHLKRKLKAEADIKRAERKDAARVAASVGTVTVTVVHVLVYLVTVAGNVRKCAKSWTTVQRLPNNNHNYNIVFTSIDQFHIPICR